jgi:hypothetical protein
MKWITKKTARATENAEAWLGDKFNSLRHTLRVEDAMNRLDHQIGRRFSKRLRRFKLHLEPRRESA